MTTIQSLQLIASEPAPSKTSSSKPSADLAFKKTFIEAKKHIQTGKDAVKQNTSSPTTVQGGTPEKLNPKKVSATLEEQGNESSKSATEETTLDEETTSHIPSFDMLSLVNDVSQHLQRQSPPNDTKTFAMTAQTDTSYRQELAIGKGDLATNDISSAHAMLLSSVHTESVDSKNIVLSAVDASKEQPLIESTNFETVATPLAPIQLAAATSADIAAKQVTAHVSPRVGHPGWGDAISQKVMWMVNDSIQSATLTLNPPDLGPLQVVLSVENDHATASFNTAHSDTQQALEAALPKLKDLMESAGLKLTDSSVSLGFSQNNQPKRDGSSGDNSAQSEQSWASLGGEEPVALTQSTTGVGLINTFA